jgi:DSF synthase
MTSITTIPTASRQAAATPSFDQLLTHYDSRYKIGWFLMRGQPRPCFNPILLQELDQYQDLVQREMRASDGARYDYLVVGSDVPGVFNLGGDLELFTRLIESRDRDQLYQYAAHCIHILHRNMHHLDEDLTTISLIQGDALGGGFEAALSSNLVVAERGVKMGLPEVLFNLFPGMGAYSLLSRKIGPARAEQMILSGQLYSAEELHELGVVDILAEPGEGELAIYNYIKQARRSPNTYRSMQRVKDVTNPVSLRELLDIAEIWADAALQLSARDIRMMHKLVKRQDCKMLAQVQSD